MKIAFLSPFYPYRGGIAQFSDLLYFELLKSNEVTAFNFKRQYPSLFFPGKTQYVNPKDKKSLKSHRTLDSVNVLSWMKTGRKIKNGNYDLMLVSYWMPFFAIPTGKPARIFQSAGGKVLAIMHNVIAHERRPGDLMMTKYFLNSCDGFIVMNDSSLEDLLKLKVDAKVKVMHHPIYSQYKERTDKNTAREKLGIEKDKKVILFFGFIRDYKGYDLILEAMKYLDDSYFLITAGEVYGSFDKYKDIIERNHIRNRLMLKLDYVSDELVPLYFSASDVCVLPYKSATQSGITATSYHFETPLIVTDTGGLGETIERDDSGLVVPGANPVSLADTILKFFSEQRMDEYVSNIRNAKQKYSWNSFAKGVEDFYRSL